MGFLVEWHMQEMANCKRETWQIEPRTYVLFVFELNDEYKIIKTTISD